VSALPPGFVRAGGPHALLVVREDLAAGARALGLDAPGGWERARTVGHPLPGGRGEALAVGLEPRVIVLRRLRHGGVLGRWLGTAFLGPHRALRELAVNAHLHAAGAPVPAPACVIAVRSRGPIWDSAVGTERVPAATPLDELLAGAVHDWPRSLAAISACARAIRRLHDRGGSHPDLNARNLLVGDSGEATAIDLDRARCGEPPGTAARARELMRLWRSLQKRGHLRGRARAERDAALGALLDGYCAGDEALRRGLARWLPWERAKLALRRWRYPR
jgi:hypothetical protein